MIDRKHEFNQQILFTDELPLNKSSGQVAPTEQVILTNNQWQPVVDVEPELIIDEKKLDSKPSWLLTVFVVSIAVILLNEFVEFFIDGFSNAPIITSIYAVAAGCITVMAGSVLWREFTGLRQYKKRNDTQRLASSFQQNPSNFDAKAFCESISKQLPEDLSLAQEKAWLSAVNSDLSPVEITQLYERIILSKVDEKAIQEIAKFSTEAVALIAISPVAIVDMFIMLWRNIRMIDKITSLYGLQLGYWSRIKLIKQVFINMAYAGVSELVADLGAEVLGAELLGKMSGRLAQGFGAGMLTARLGLKVINLSRPMPFHVQQPTLQRVRKQVLLQAKSLITLKSKAD